MSRYLFVIDYQNDFVDGALGFPGAEKLDGKIADKVRAYGEGKVLFTRDTHFENYLTTREGKNLPVVHCIKDTPGWRAILPCCLTNGAQGYFPMRSAFDEGGYEARSSSFKAGVAERIIVEGKEILASLR